jgi:hypothetical protein
MQRSANMNLVYKVTETPKVEILPPPQPTPVGFTEEEWVEGVGIALGAIKNRAFDYADAVEGRLHTELVALRNRIAALEERNADNVVGKNKCHRLILPND